MTVEESQNKILKVQPAVVCSTKPSLSILQAHIMEALALSAPCRIVLRARHMKMSKPGCQGLFTGIHSCLAILKIQLHLNSMFTDTDIELLNCW